MDRGLEQVPRLLSLSHSRRRGEQQQQLGRDVDSIPAPLSLVPVCYVCDARGKRGKVIGEKTRDQGGRGERDRGGR